MVTRVSSVGLIVPFATWMALMTLLPPTGTCYAVRAAATLIVLAVVALRGGWLWVRPTWRDLADGILVGLAVFAVWILPEQFDCPLYHRYCIVGEGGTAAIAEASTGIIVLRLLGSALVIPVAEELFFRKWLIPFAGFLPMVALFAVEHDRWLVGAVAGAAYGLLYLRRGLWSAILAHAVTNLVLGLWVLRTGQWQFW